MGILKVTVWGNLGREGSKGIQLAIATYHLLVICRFDHIPFAFHLYVFIATYQYHLLVKCR